MIKKINRQYRPVVYSILVMSFLVMAPCALHAQIGEVEILTLISGKSSSEDKRIHVSGLLVDTARNKVACLVRTYEGDLPVTHDAYMDGMEKRDKWSIYFVIYDADLTRILYATYLIGSEHDVPYSMSWDESGEHAILAGTTRSYDFPVTENAAQTALRGKGDLWYARFDMDRHEFTYITYLGGNRNETIARVVIAGDGRLLIGGYTSSTDLPLRQETFSRQPDINGDAVVFVLRDDSLLHAVCFGGRSDESLRRIIETEDSFVLIGLTWSSDFPVTDNAFQTSFGGIEDVFILRTDKEFRSIEYCSYLGGISNDMLQTARNIGGRVHIVGEVNGEERFPLTHAGYGYDTLGYWSGFYTIYDPESDTVPFSSLIRGHNAETINDLIALDDERVLLFVSSNSDTLLTMVKDTPGDWETMMQLVIEFDLVEMQPRKMQLLWNNWLSMNTGKVTPTHNGIYFTARTARQLPVQPSGVQTEYLGGFEAVVARLRLHETTRAAPLPERSSMVSLVPYPNPSSGPATVLLAAPPGSYTLHLYGSDGRLHRMHTVDHAGTSASSTSLPLTGLAAGQYQLIAIDSHGAPVARSGLVIW
jgi:hypothetical protein